MMPLSQGRPVNTALMGVRVVRGSHCGHHLWTICALQAKAGPSARCTAQSSSRDRVALQVAQRLQRPSHAAEAGFTGKVMTVSSWANPHWARMRERRQDRSAVRRTVVTGGTGSNGQMRKFSKVHKFACSLY